MNLYMIKKILKKWIQFYKLILVSLLLYFINIKFSYAYINPGIFGMFLQLIVVFIAFLWFCSFRIKILVKSFFKKIIKIKKNK